MYTLAMDTFDPKSELIQLLGTTPTHPWAALIPQILLWCFRRFCVKKLMLFDGGLRESLCEDILDLVHAYCPRGLEMVSIEWFTPENIEHVSSTLEEYMAYMDRFCKYLDDSIHESDYDAQDTLSEFLDASIAIIIREWLDAKHLPFFIFPTETESDDEFTEAQFSKLINALLLYSYTNKSVGTPELPEPVQVPAEAPQPVQVPAEVPQAVQAVQPVKASQKRPAKPVSLLWYLIPIPKAQPPVQVPAPPAPAAPPPPVEKTTIAEVMNRRRTLCVTGRRSKEARVKTRKTHPAALTKKE